MIRKVKVDGTFEWDDMAVVQPIPEPTPTPTPTDPNLEFKGDFSKPDGTTLMEKQNDGSLYVTSGNLAWRGGCWTSSDPTFRFITLKDTFTDVAINFQARLIRFTDINPKAAYDGLHIFARYRSQYHLYVATFMRRDQTATLKKKCPGGDGVTPDPHGTYYDFTSVSNPFIQGVWYGIKLQMKNDASDTMKMVLSMNGKIVTTYIDNGKDKNGVPHVCNQIMRGGAVGIRADNCQWEIKDFEVRSQFPYP